MEKLLSDVPFMSNSRSQCPSESYSMKNVTLAPRSSAMRTTRREIYFRFANRVVPVYSSTIPTAPVSAIHSTSLASATPLPLTV